MLERRLELVLTCPSWQAAQRVADALLEQKLISSVEFFEVSSSNLLHNHPHTDKQIKLIIQSLDHLSQQLEKVIESMHNKIKVDLQTIPVASGIAPAAQ